MADEFTKVLHIQGDAAGAIGEIRRLRQEHSQLAAQVAGDGAAMEKATTRMSGANQEYASRVAEVSRGEAAGRFVASDAGAEEERARRQRDRFSAMADIERTGQAPNRIRSFMDRLANVGRMSVGSLFGFSSGEADKAAASADKVGQAVEQAGEHAARARPKLGALAHAAGMIVPEFGQVISMAGMLKNALSALITVPGALFAGIGVAFGTLLNVISTTEERIRKVAEEMERARKQSLEREAGARGTAAGMGVGPAAAKKGAAIAAGLEAKGYKPDTAKQAGVLAADQGLTSEQAEQIAAGIDTGQLGDVGRSAASRKRAIDALLKHRLSRPAEDEANRAARGDAAAQRVEDIREQIRAEEKRAEEAKGGISHWFRAAKEGPMSYVGTHPDTEAHTEGLQYELKKAEERLAQIQNPVQPVAAASNSGPAPAAPAPTPQPVVNVVINNNVRGLDTRVQRLQVY